MMYVILFLKIAFAILQGHPTDLFLTISVLQSKFSWLGTEVSAVLLGSKVLNLRSRISQMYQKFLLEIFYPSNLLEIFLGCISSLVSGVIGSSQVAPLFARIVRAESPANYLFTADQKICTWAPLLEIRNQATLRHWITGKVHWRLGRFIRFMFMQKVRTLLNSLMYYIQVGLNRIHKRYI